MIGESGRNAERFRQVRNSPEIHLLRWRRICACAFEQRDLRRPLCPCRRHRLSISASVAIPVERINGLPVRATLRISGRSTSSKDAILYAPTPIFSKKSTAESSNGLEKNAKPSSLRDGLEFRLPLPWHRCFAVEIIQVAVFPDRAMADPEMLFLRIDGDRVCGVSLHFDRIRAGRSRGANEFNRCVEIVLMICGELGDHVNRMRRIR